MATTAQMPPLNMSGSNNISNVSESQTKSFSSSGEQNSGELPTFQGEALPNITVEEFLKKLAKDIEAKIMNRAEEHGQKLKDLFEQEKTVLLAEAKRIRLGGSSKAPLKMITFEVTGGEGGPKKMKVKVGGEKLLVAKVGRSRGAQFVEGKGISLHWDRETSTTHGQFIFREDEVCFEDLHSTNETTVIKGETTVHLGKTRETRMLRIEKDDVLNIGTCTLKVLSIEDAEA